MLALSPLFSTSCGWPLADQMCHEENWTGLDPLMSFNYRSPKPCHSPESQPETEIDTARPSDITSFDASIVKKLNHNARERDRQRKLNDLYSSLQSLLPATDRKRRSSIPTTVSRVLKNIPELQKQVEKLVERKDGILSSIGYRQGDHHLSCLTKQGKPGNIGKCFHTVSTSQLDDREVVIQICGFKAKRNPIPEVLVNLEGEDLHVLNASSA